MVKNDTVNGTAMVSKNKTNATSTNQTLAEAPANNKSNIDTSLESSTIEVEKDEPDALVTDANSKENPD